MYVLADIEWIENKAGKISFTQVAMIRVDKDWNIVRSISRRIKPKDESFHHWKHMAFTGGTITDYMTAQDSIHAFDDISHWLWPSDIICWWTPDSMDWVQKLVPTITNRQIVIAERVANYVGKKPSNAYTLGKHLALESPGEKHNSKNDAEMMRRVLEAIRFPQPIPEIITPAPQKSETYSANYSFTYIADYQKKIIHKKGCPHLLASGSHSGYNELKKIIGKGFLPCDCVKADYRAAQRKRTQEIISNSEYAFIYAPNSNVFHRRECKIMLAAKTVWGSIHYDKCIQKNLRPCKCCNPLPEHETLKHVASRQKSTGTKQVPINANHTPAYEQRAIKRHRQAQEQRRAFVANTSLSTEKRDDLFTLSQPAYAFFAAKGYDSFHLRHCKKLSGLNNIKGFGMYHEANRAGYRPCKCCKPTSKHDILVSLPIYSTERFNESIDDLKKLSAQANIQYWEDSGLCYMKTNVGIWRVNTNHTPYRLEHINLIKTPHNRTEFHRQPRLFLSLADVIRYIKRHDHVPSPADESADITDRVG